MATTGQLPAGFPLRLGRTSDELREHYTQLAEQLATQHQASTDILADIATQLEALRHQLADALPRPPLREVVTFDAGINSHMIQTRGYRHNRIRCTGAVTLNVRDTIGNYTLTLAAGWNTLDLPNGADISATAATIAELEYSDDANH